MDSTKSFEYPPQEWEAVCEESGGVVVADVLMHLLKRCRAIPVHSDSGSQRSLRTLTTCEL